jgi:tetratricopeptide (TPR) repeat protein
LTRAYVDRGDVNRELGNADQAIADYTAAIERKPDLTGARVQRAFLNANAGRLDAVLADCDVVVELDPGSWQASAMRGMTRQKLGWDSADVIADLQRAYAHCDEPSTKALFGQMIRDLGGTPAEPADG